MITHTNTLTKHYYIQSSATLLPPSQRNLYPNAAPLITLHGLFHEPADLPLYQDKHKGNLLKQIRFFYQTVKTSAGVATEGNLRNAHYADNKVHKRDIHNKGISGPTKLTMS